MKYNHTSRISKRIILSSEPFTILSTWYALPLYALCRFLLIHLEQLLPL